MSLVPHLLDPPPLPLFLSRSVSAEECCLPATCTCGAKIKGIPLLFRLFSSCTHTAVSHTHTNTCLQHFGANYVGAAKTNVAYACDTTCHKCLALHTRMRHFLPNYLPFPLPPTSLPLIPRHIERSLAGCELPLGLTSLSVWKWRCESVKVICKVDVAVPAAVAASLPGALPVGGFCLLLWQLIMRRLSM